MTKLESPFGHYFHSAVPLTHLGKLCFLRGFRISMDTGERNPETISIQAEYPIGRIYCKRSLAHTCLLGNLTPSGRSTCCPLYSKIRKPVTSLQSFSTWQNTHSAMLLHNVSSWLSTCFKKKVREFAYLQYKFPELILFARCILCSFA